MHSKSNISMNTHIHTHIYVYMCNKYIRNRMHLNKSVNFSLCKNKYFMVLVII